MEMSGEYKINASRQKVWDALNDPEILKQSIPGCEEIEQKSPTEMSAKVTAKVGPVKAKFAGEVDVLEALQYVQQRLPVDQDREVHDGRGKGFTLREAGDTLGVLVD